MNKIPLLLLPGLLCDAEVWSYQCQQLSDIADCIIPDLNHATTPKEMVTSALSAAPLHFALAGHSMGGWVALEIMKSVPERVLGLALLNTTAFPDSKEKYAARQAMIAMAKKGKDAEIIHKLLNAFVHRTTVKNDVKVMLERNFSSLISQECAMLKREDCISDLEKITCPTLIIHAAEDAVFHLEDSKLLSMKIKSSTLSIIENCGHMSPMESPVEVARLMGLWLGKLMSYCES